MSDPEKVVRDFCAAFGQAEIPEILGFFAEDAVYHNIPMEPAEGLPAIEAFLKQFVDPSGDTEFEILHLAVAGDTVLTERVDRMAFAGKSIVIRVMGTFEVNPDGKIRAWRDYFDMAELMKQVS